MCVDASSSRLHLLGSAPQNGGYRVQWAKREGASHEREQSTKAHLRKAVPLRDQPLVRWSPGPKAAKENVDGLVLCERHALEAKLEGQIECWGGILFHIELWSREARRREREDVVGLLEVQRAEAISARQLARTDLDRLRSRDTSLGTLGSAERVLRR